MFWITRLTTNSFSNTGRAIFGAAAAFAHSRASPKEDSPSPVLASLNAKDLFSFLARQTEAPLDAFPTKAIEGRFACFLKGESHVRRRYVH